MSTWANVASNVAGYVANIAGNVAGSVARGVTDTLSRWRSTSFFSVFSSQPGVPPRLETIEL